MMMWGFSEKIFYNKRINFGEIRKKKIKPKNFINYVLNQ